ncbi:MAG: PrgI family protein, partial [Clostridia bacterium]|nr:PrgI family protein [Clostridia bacterium]
YHGLNAEQLLWVWLKSEIIEPKKLIFESTTLYYDVLKENITKRKKEAMKSNDKNSPDND